MMLGNYAQVNTREITYGKPSPFDGHGLKTVDGSLGPIYTVRFLSHATSSPRQAYDMTYDCCSVFKRVLKCYDIFSDVHNNRKSCRGHVVSRMGQKSYRVRADLHGTIFVACDNCF